ncbi:VWA domain-containing protein [Methylophaga sp.]|uniref:VWA domain-containing protein n=1 Tax=Methylophaga sp. TaxID=2024840 RepID=UPI003F6A0E4D
MAHKPRRAEGSNLAFLDIMSCGLGAVILVFMLVKQNVSDSPAEIDNLKNDISALEQARDESKQRLNDIRDTLKKENIDISQMRAKLSAQRADVNQKNEDLASSSSTLDELKQSITKIKVPKKEDLIETNQVNEEEYLLGLKVEGRKIAILLDVSASMTNKKLIDIIKTKSSSDNIKVRSAKWIRTQRVLEWLLARLPKTSDVVVVAYSEDAIQLGGKGWISANNVDAIRAINSAANRLVPQGPTNLQKGLDTISKFAPTNLYVITDGLPTKGESRFKSLNPFSSCSSLTGTGKTISGECRKRLFRQTIKESGNLSAQVDVILLPLEGDPEAAYEYWIWSSSRGGIMISPADNWP